MFLFTRCSELDFRYTIMFTMFSLQGAQDLIFDVLCLHSFCLHGRKLMFYLTMHSTHFIYGYMASDIWLRTILIVRKETRCRHIGYSFRLTARVLLYAPSHRQDSTYHGLCYTSRGALAGTRIVYTVLLTMFLGVHHSFFLLVYRGAGRSSEVERSLMVRWLVGSILHGVDPLSYFSFQPVLHDWYNKGLGMCYPVCGMVHIKEPLLLIGKSSLCGGSRFPFSLSEWSLTIF